MPTARAAARSRLSTPFRRCLAVGILCALAVFASAASAQAATLYVAVGGNDVGSCTSAAPCGSFGRAYRVAAPGDVVEVAAGRYGNQRIDPDPAKEGTVAEVLIRPALGAAVVITDLLSFASNVRYSGFTVALDSGGQPDIRAGHDVVVENVKATNFYVQGPTRRVTIRGGEYGPYLSSGGGSQIKTLTAGGD